jgi:hypothetical protein
LIFIFINIFKRSVTERPKTWHQSCQKNAVMGRVADLQLKKNEQQKPDKYFDPFSDEDIEALCAEIAVAGSSSAVGLYAIENEEIVTPNGPDLQSFRREELKHKSLLELQEEANTIDISFNQAYADDVFFNTLQQSKSKKWQSFRLFLLIDD